MVRADGTYNMQQVLIRAWKDTISVGLAHWQEVRLHAKKQSIGRQLQMIESFHLAWTDTEFFCIKVDWGGLQWQFQLPPTFKTCLRGRVILLDDLE